MSLFMSAEEKRLEREDLRGVADCDLWRLTDIQLIMLLLKVLMEAEGVSPDERLEKELMNRINGDAK